MIKIPVFNFSIYSLFLILSFVLTFIILAFISKKHLSFEKYSLSFILIVWLMILCGFLLQYIINHQIGITSYGGVIGCIIGLLIYTSIDKDNKQYVINLYTLSLPLLYGLTKLSCFFSGCCYGIKYSGLLSIKYEFLNYCVFPIQLLETIIFLSFFIVFCYLFNKKNVNISYKLFIVCAITKFLLDYLRYYQVRNIFSINQIISLVVIILVLFFKYKKES